MSAIKRVISVGAHSLDAELLGGPLLLKYAKRGARCTLVHVTQGRLEDPAATEEARAAYLGELLNQNKRAAERLGWILYGWATYPAACPTRRNSPKGWRSILPGKKPTW